VAIWEIMGFFVFVFFGVANTYEVLAEDEIYRDQALEAPECSDQV